LKARRASGFLLAALLGAMVSARPDATWSAEPVDAPGASRPVSEEAPRRQLPPALHAHHGALFPERPDVVGRTRGHAPPPVWREATRRFGRAVSLDADGRLRGYVAGTAFPTETIDCTEDPRAGDKLAWNFAHRWMGDGGLGTLRVSSWDQGELLGPPVVARWLLARLHHRVEPVHLAAEAKKERGALFPTARRTEALTLDIEHPFVQRGIRIVQYRYVWRLERPDDLWVYVPRRRRVQRIQSTRWTQALPGTDLVLEDWRGMGGPVRAHRFACEEERRILAPMRRRGAPDPLQEEATPPSPAEVARTHVVLEPRSAVRIRATPRDPRHPYGFKDLWLDRETFEPLYLLAYDREGRALRVGYQVNAWSGDVPERYSGWAGVPELTLPRSRRHARSHGSAVGVCHGETEAASIFERVQG